MSSWTLKQLQTSLANFFVKQRPFPTHLAIHPVKSLLTLLRCSDPGGKILLVLWIRVKSSWLFSALASFFEIRQTWLRRVSAWDLFREGMAGTNSWESKRCAQFTLSEKNWTHRKPPHGSQTCLHSTWLAAGSMGPTCDAKGCKWGDRLQVNCMF
jgi:hypothetical protein